MSTASPLPLQPLPPSTLSDAEARALKQEVASRLADHRQRKPRAKTNQTELPLEGSLPSRHSAILNSVAARYSNAVSYRDVLEHEAHAAIRQAEAEAEVARRSADAIVAAQQRLLEEIEQWNSQGESHAALDVAAAVAAPMEQFVAEAAHLEQKAFAAMPTVREAPLETAVPLPTNLIEFPRQLVAARRARPSLALGPLREDADASPERAQLRIFEVEASSFSTVPSVESGLPEWHSIRFDTPLQDRDMASAESEMSFALPLYVAPTSLRAMAMAVDTCCITTAFLLAVAAASYVSPVLPTGLPALLAGGLTLFALGLFYHLMFFSLGDATPGMRYARIGLCTFGDENPTRSAMRRRMGAVLLAGMPLGLGLLWACLDEEGLGWHDRISRIYPRAY